MYHNSSPLQSPLKEVEKRVARALNLCQDLFSLLSSAPPSTFSQCQWQWAWMAGMACKLSKLMLIAVDMSLLRLKTSFFQVVHSMPSRFHVIRTAGAAGGRLQTTDVAISVHIQQSASPDVAAICLDVARIGGNGIVMLRDMHEIPYEQLKAMNLWTVNKMYLSFVGIRPATSELDLQLRHELLDMLTSSNAYASSSSCLDVVGEELLRLQDCIREFVALDLISSVAMPLRDYGAQLAITVLGAQRITSVVTLADPSPLLVVRPEKPLTELTLHELMLRTIDEGWMWRSLPSGRLKRQSLKYKIGEEKVAYFNPTALPHRLYLVCLLRCADLCKDDGTIPHCVKNPAQVGIDVYLSGFSA